MTGTCLVHRCDADAVTTYRTEGDVPWPVCATHQPEIADLLGIANPAKENR